MNSPHEATREMLRRLSTRELRELIQHRDLERYTPEDFDLMEEVLVARGEGGLLPAPDQEPDAEATAPDHGGVCPYCEGEISESARKCRHCGEWVAYPEGTCGQCGTALKGEWARRGVCANCSRTAPAVLPARRQEWSPGVAAVLSLAIPGAGQMYKGRLGAGFGWLFGTALGYLFFIIPGLVLHVLSIVNAYSGDPTRKGG